jgi:hypothetical protein
MAKTVSLSGKTYTIPEPGDVGWGSLSDLIERLALDTQALLDSSLATPVPLRRRVREVTSSPASLLTSDDVVLVDIASPSSLNLPDGSLVSQGKVITIKDVSGAAGTNPISIFPFGGATIEGASQYDIDENYGDFTVVFDGTDWARIQSLEDDFENGQLPLGALVPLTSHLTGSFSPPASGVVKRGLMLCDGSAIPAGQKVSGTLPDLTDNRFLMGATSSGASGSATDLTHDHTFTHAHSGTTGTQTVTFSGTVSTTGGAASFDKTALNSDQSSHDHTYQLEYTQAYNTFSKISGGFNALIQAYDYASGTFVGGSSVAAPVNRGWNTGLSTGTTAISAGTLKTLTATTTSETVSWTSASVSTTFTDPTFDAADVGAAQTAHDHTFTTSSQSSSTTANALGAVTEVRPQYFEVIYLMRVS